jgi:multiple sugar transport system permease protein
MTTLPRVARPGTSPALRRWRRPLTILAFLAPGIVGFAVFFLYPLLATIYFSFMRYDLISVPEFVGLDNYRFFLHSDPKAWVAIRNTLWLLAVLVPARILFALAVSQVLLTVRRGQGLVRALFYLPALAPPVAATLMFVFLFNPGSGLANTALRAIGIEGPLWFQDPAWAKPSLVLLGLWGVGDVMIILLAALLDVPRQLYEAADLDGAGPFQRWRYITLPTIAPVLMFSAVTGIIATLQYFTQPAVAAQVASGSARGTLGETMGFPQGSTLTFPQWLYFQGFKDFQLGYASVLALLLFAVALIFVLILLRQFRDTISGR